jgi:hypothetical protein
MAAVAMHCAHHPDRPGHALCMECRRVVCEECATDWQGINYCAPCLARRRQALGAGRTWPGRLALLLACAALVAVLTRLMAWTGVLLAGLL